MSCILLKFYIKPQQLVAIGRGSVVVSYWNSTSNHNCRGKQKYCSKLYLIEILHQTTTLPAAALHWLGCILLKFYIKPQLCNFSMEWRDGCILLKFYIKPQLTGGELLRILSCILLKFYIKPQPRNFSPRRMLVVSYWNSTSNHNREARSCPPS